jgi:sugar phosphate permease
VAIGTILATTPLAYFTSLIGWRMTFILSGAMTMVLAFFVFWVLKEKTVRKEVGGGAAALSKNQEIGLFQSLRLILGSFTFWQIGIVAFFRYGTFVSLQGLWLGPYLMNIKGYSPIEAGNILIFLSIGWVVGGPLGGRLSDRTSRSRKGVPLWGLSLYCLSLAPLIGILKIESFFWYSFIFFCLGFFNVVGAGILSHAKELFPISISGTVLTLVNFFSMCGAAFFMPILGRIIESFEKTGQGYPAEAYHFSFLICALSMAASVIFYAFSKKGTNEFKKGGYQDVFEWLYKSKWRKINGV